MGNAAANERYFIDQLRCVLAEARAEFDTAHWEQKQWEEFVDFIIQGMAPDDET